MSCHGRVESSSKGSSF